jgi:tetratricopeptide (TPR) repeat protein
LVLGLVHPKYAKGNGYARQGRWDLAEKEWQAAADQHPTNAAAWHNLAISAVAREDFELARSRLKHADNIARGRTTDKTERWLETQERNYKTIMGLPEPQGGWRYSD